MHLLLILSLLQLSNSKGTTLELVEKIPVHFEWAHNMRNMVYVENKAYFYSIVKYDINVFDLISRKSESTIGGRGNGPGEFDSGVNQMSVSNDRLIVQTGRWLHFFDHNGRFMNRIHVKESAIYRMAPYLKGSYLVGSRFLTGEEKLSDISYIGVLNAENGSIAKQTRFGKPNTIPNIFLSQYVFDADDRRIVVAQSGSNELNYYRHDGAIEKSVSLDKYPVEIKYQEAPSFSDRPLGSGSSSKSIIDRRMPSFLVVYDVALSTDFTVVAGYFQQDGRRRFMAIINHTTWEVSYPSIQSPCLSLNLNKNKLVCLNTSSGIPVIHVYNVVI
jgi:hypothetical protein